MDYFFNMAIAVVLAAIKGAIKNPEKAEEVKRALLKVRNAIDLLYGEVLPEED